MSALPRMYRSPGPLRPVLLAIVLAAPLFAGASGAQAPRAAEGLVTRSAGRCGVCHPKDRVAFEASPHSREEVRCVSCHGGDDGAIDEKSAHSGNGWRGRISRRQVPELCASCHSKSKLMQPYDLPVDQYALYLTSAHGRKLQEGDTKAAVCSDCHGAHDILAASDPMSRVYVTNIPRTCGSCHGDSTLIAARGMKDVYRGYLTSVHAKELFDAGNLGAPTCVSCHGVHGAAPAEVADVNKVCGRCHTQERRFFLSGPHASGMSRNDLSECTSCHGDHAIQASDPERLASSCVDCHDAGDREAKLGEQLLADYRSAIHEIEKAEKWVAKA
ncbi:MAG TPA: cytochrome c3 family protein, partial [Gemmatimonadaceae bacterium]|nr:cytochrome c3 family protein [Gemmatimonadaceae bacterium]